jgi:hypothetical protein
MFLYSQIKEYYPRKPVHITTKKTELTDSLRKDLEIEFSDKTFVQSEIETLLQKKHYITLSLENISIHYIPIAKLSQKHVEQVLYRLYIATKMFHIQVPLLIWFLPCTSPRQFPQTTEMVQAKHINGGYTYTTDHTIYVYRYEEFPKVMLHEVLHNSKLHSHFWDPTSTHKLYELFDIDMTGCNYTCKTKLLPNEAIIEAWAIMFQLCCVSLEEKISLQTLYEEEVSWGLYQSKKLLEHQEKYFPEWIETTHSYSYIYLKTCILYHWNTFEKIPFPYDTKVLSNFFETYSHTPRFLQKIKNAKNYRSKSFRMTRFGDR